MMASFRGVIMAHKVPVGGTITHAYRFAFGNILNNLGAMWIPAAIMYAIMFVFRGSYTNTILSMSANPQAALAGLQYVLVAMIVFGILIAAQIAGITKEALGLRTGNAWLQFPFGAATWRLLGAYLLYLIVMIVLYIGVFVVSLLFAGIAAGVAGAGAGMARRGAIVADRNSPRYCSGSSCSAPSFTLRPGCRSCWRRLSSPNTRSP